MDQRSLNIILKLQNEASKELEKFSKDADKTGVNMKKVAAVGVAAFATITAAIGKTVMAYAESEKEVAKVDAIFKSMEGTTRKVSTGLTQTTSVLKVTGIEAEKMRNAIDSANTAIKEQEYALKKARDKLNDEKISKKEYLLVQERVKNNIRDLNLKITEYNAKLTETEVSQTTLTKSVTVTSGELKKARDTIMEASAAATRLGFDDEMAAVSMSMFYQRTGDVTRAMELNALAMDLARSKGIDLESAAKMVSLALSGNARALKEYGIEIDETLGPVAALEELQKKVAGQADAYANTIAGKTEIIKQSFGDLQESIGKLFAGSIVDALGAVQGLIDRLQYVADNIPKVKEAFGEFFQQIDEKTGLITLMREAVDNMTFYFNERLKPALVELWAALEPFKPILDYMVQVFGTMLVAAIGALIYAIELLVIMFTELLTWATKIGTFFAGWLKKKFEEYGDSVLKTIELVEKLVGWYKKAIDYADELGKKAAKSIISKVLPGRATGGPVTGNQAYMVGEQGPEMFVPRVSGTIIPNGALAYAGAGGVTVNVYGDISGSELVDKVSRAIADSIKRRQRIA